MSLGAAPPSLSPARPGLEERRLERLCLSPSRSELFVRLLLFVNLRCLFVCLFICLFLRLQYSSVCLFVHSQKKVLVTMSYTLLRKPIYLILTIFVPADTEERIHEASADLHDLGRCQNMLWNQHQLKHKCTSE